MLAKMTNQRFSKKIFHFCIVCVIIIIIIFIAMMLVLRYDENGETNLPFEISKISIISTVDGEDVEDSENKWHINVIQNNDIYIYVKKNEKYKKQETIKSVKLDNFYISKPTVGEIKKYKPIINDTTLFKNVDENIIDFLEFKGAKSTDTRNLQISNQGGVICFRCANINIGTYLSNDDAEINYNQLISKLNLNETDLNAKVRFDITITLNSGKAFKAESVEIVIPNEEVTQDGTIGKEFTQLQDIIFKRTENCY